MLAFSEFTPSTENIEEKNIDRRKPKPKLKMTRQTLQSTEKEEGFSSSLHNTDDGEFLGDFSPPPPPNVSVKQPPNPNKHDTTSKIAAFSAMENSSMKPLIVNQERPYNNDNLSSSYQQYLSSHNQNYNNNNLGANLNTQPGTQDELLKKINYMIQLLEEQQGEKTNNVTEEVILYSFLGIFMIYMADSFARIGKYSR